MNGVPGPLGFCAGPDWNNRPQIGNLQGIIAAVSLAPEIGADNGRHARIIIFLRQFNLDIIQSQHGGGRRERRTFNAGNAPFVGNFRIAVDIRNRHFAPIRGEFEILIAGDRVT